jgi:hypothetical protein
MAILHALYSSNERRLSDPFLVGFVATKEPLFHMYWDVAVVSGGEELGNEEFVYSGLAHQDLQTLVKDGVLCEAKVPCEISPKLRDKTVDGYEITKEGMLKGYAMMERLGYKLDVPPL